MGSVIERYESYHFILDLCCKNNVHFLVGLFMTTIPLILDAVTFINELKFKIITDKIERHNQTNQTFNIKKVNKQ